MYKSIILFLLILTSLNASPLPSPPINQAKTSEPCVIVIFGATGDLTARKLLPAIYNLAYEGAISDNTIIVGFARASQTQEVFRSQMGKAIDQYSRRKPRDPAFWQQFENRIFYHQVDFDQDQGYAGLHQLLAQIDQKYGTCGNRLYYLATQPASFSTIIKKLDEHHLISPHESQKGWSRVLIEKPFGYDLDSAMALQQEITRHLNENQIYRIDHYLAKEGVENLFSLRFAGAAFEPLWNSSHIDNIQITLGEDIGIGTRGHFWEGTGFLRDILQNHLMQLLALIAMDPPISHDAPAAHAEKIKVLQAVRPFPIHAMDEFILRGQYGPGLIQGSPVLAYRQEQNVSDNSFVETYAAAKIFIDNERWHNVPFYIRGGKRLPKQIAEIAVTFKNKGCPETQKQDVLFIRIQPNPAIFLKTTCRSGSKRELIPISISRPQVFMDAYEKLLYDAIGGDDRLFVPIEEQLAAWRLLTPVLQYWSSHRNVTFPNYDAGSWGPSQADLMLKAEGRQWQLLEN